MEAYDFLNEKLKPIIKGDYQDFSSKKVEGYSLFVCIDGNDSRK